MATLVTDTPVADNLDSPPLGFKPGVCEGESATAQADLVLQAAIEPDSISVGEVPAGALVYVLEVQEMLGGAQRALVALGDPARGHSGGWVTSVSLQGTQYLLAGRRFVRPNAEVSGTAEHLAAAMEKLSSNDAGS